MIVIMSAMQEEIQTLLHKLKDVEIIEKGMRNYYIGTLFNKKIVLVFSRWGKVAAAATTTQLINDFNPSEIIFTGVAGSLKKNINIGDVVIGDKLFQYDVDCSPIFEKFEIPILKKKYFKIENTEKIQNATLRFLKDYNKYISTENAVQFNIQTPNVFVGDIATGDQFVSTKQKVTELNTQLPSVLCTEMEGAAVAQVCYEYKVPFSIIRVISDKANDNATIDFPKFAKNIASNYALGILKNYFLEKD